MPSPTSFARRWNHDGSIDSICSVCYRTVASAHTEFELQQAEQKHACLPLGGTDRTIDFVDLANRSMYPWSADKRRTN